MGCYVYLVNRIQAQPGSFTLGMPSKRHGVPSVAPCPIPSQPHATPAYRQQAPLTYGPPPAMSYTPPFPRASSVIPRRKRNTCSTLVIKPPPAPTSACTTSQPSCTARSTIPAATSPKSTSSPAVSTALSQHIKIGIYLKLPLQAFPVSPAS